MYACALRLCICKHSRACVQNTLRYEILWYIKPGLSDTNGHFQLLTNVRFVDGVFITETVMFCKTQQKTKTTAKRSSI